MLCLFLPHWRLLPTLHKKTFHAAKSIRDLGKTTLSIKNVLSKVLSLVANHRFSLTFPKPNSINTLICKIFPLLINTGTLWKWSWPRNFKSLPRLAKPENILTGAFLIFHQSGKNDWSSQKKGRNYWNLIVKLTKTMVKVKAMYKNGGWSLYFSSNFAKKCTMSVRWAITLKFWVLNILRHSN